MIASKAAEVLGWQTSAFLNAHYGPNAGDVFFVLAGRRFRPGESYTFNMSLTAVRTLADSINGFVVLGFVDQEFFLVIPWGIMADRFMSLEKDKISFRIPVDRHRNVGLYGEFRHPIDPRNPST